MRNALLFSVWFCFIVFPSGTHLAVAKWTGLNNMERRIILLSIGEIEDSVLDTLERDLGKKYDCRIRRHEPIDVPAGALNPARGQYHSSFILQEARRLVGAEKQDIVLGVTDVDLYTGGLNFVFGEAELGGRWAIISLTRLRQAYYSLPENRALFSARVMKEAVHELGHVFGLEHCSNPECVMRFSNSLADTDRKSASFCPRCQKRLQAETL